ncbi:hypothetical protein F5J12DRAFT_926324 [Pisolithus orientalis]|uniref:uncharacterized protein n=1 Tax=Pisolithus orientalis TaxID=936130 RepID=UPI0022255F1A|nr:uncharacterized protein F5J12DRAFT_926324 [Pisolithus orientalis]KAI6012389.1 hypothetical protein F5J12DRAFT_926324 [Pisolithus orientalis]
MGKSKIAPAGPATRVTQVTWQQVNTTQGYRDKMVKVAPRKWVPGHATQLPVQPGSVILNHLDCLLDDVGEQLPSNNDVLPATPFKPWKSQNSYLQQWLPHQWHYLAILLDMEAPPEPRDCVLCGADGIFQCIECAHQPVFCTMCCQAEHKHWPFHRVEQWNGTFFEESSLQLASLVLHVGHGGKHCPASGCSNDEVTAEEEDDWEDVDQDGCPPNLQALKNQSCLIVVHTNGIHYCNVQYCRCPGAEDSHIQLMWAGMFPATTKATRTAFTFQDRYRELRVARMWWLLKLLKWQGSHTSAEDASPGELVWTLARSLVMDGNFKAEHMHPKDAGSKAWLMDGKGYMVTSQPYKEYLSSTKNVVEISDCSNHQAVNQANANQQWLTSTGIGDVPVHGMAVLCCMQWSTSRRVNSMNNLVTMQVNMDYVLVHAIRHGTVPGQQVIHFYDINCQYSKDGMWICPGIGLWHVHGHHTECFAQYAPNFIVGAGQVDGEIMETLWSSLNIISPSVRGMATPHQQEATAMRLKQKLKVAEESYLVVEGRFADLNGNVPLAISQSWGEEAAAALENQLSRPQAMDIYEVRLQKGFALSGIEAPSEKEIEIDLLAIPQPGHSQGMVTWIAKALKIEEAQIQLTVACQHITSRATEAQNLHHCIFEDAKLCWSSNPHDPETIALLLPSNVGKDHFEQSGLGYVTIMELQLWQGQANDCLHELWLVLAEKAVIFQTDIHHGSNYHMATHAWGRVANTEAAVQCHAAVYFQCHIQMGRLGARPVTGALPMENKVQTLVHPKVDRVSQMSTGVKLWGSVG